MSLPPQALLDQARQHQADTLLRRPSPAVALPVPTAKRWNLLRHLRYSYTGGLLPMAVPAADLRVVLAPSGSAFRADAQASTASQKVAAHYAFGVQLDLTPQWAAYATTRHLLGQLRGEGWEAGFTYQHQLTTQGRPLRVRASLGYLRQSAGRQLGTFANPDADLRLASTPLAAEELALSLHTITDALQPRLGLGLELTHHWEAVADLGWLLPLRTRSQLLIEEKKGFFSFNEHAADLDLPAAEATVHVNSQPATGGPWQQGRWLLSLGVLYRLGQ